MRTKPLTQQNAIQFLQLYIQSILTRYFYSICQILKLNNRMPRLLILQNNKDGISAFETNSMSLKSAFRVICANYRRNFEKLTEMVSSIPSHTLQYFTQAAIMLHGFGFVPKGLNFVLSVFSVSIILKYNYQLQIFKKEAFYAINLQKTGDDIDIIGQYTIMILQNSLFYYPFIGFN